MSKLPERAKNRLRRLFSIPSLPGWAVFLWNLISNVSNVEYIAEWVRRVMPFAAAVFDWLLTPNGSWAMAAFTVAWLTGVVLLPERRTPPLSGIASVQPPLQSPATSDTHNLVLLEVSRPRISFWLGAFLHRAAGNSCPDRGEALALVFWNKPRSGQTVGMAKNVRARLTFRDKGTTPLNIIVGWWLGGDTISVDIPPTESRELVVAAVQDPEPLVKEKYAAIAAISGNRTPVPRNVYTVDARDLLQSQSTPVYVALTAEAYSVEVEVTVAGKIVGGCELALKTKPTQELTISRQFYNWPSPEANETLDVRLEGTFPGTFALHASGHACEIRISPIAIEATRIGTDEGRPLIYPRQTLEFQIVSGLRDSVLPLEPTLLSWEGHGRSSSTWPRPGTAEAMKQFLHALWLVRRYRAAQSVLGHDDIDFRSNQFNDAELELFTERLQQPSEIAFDISYWNSERTLNWKRTEQLVFEPQTNTAFVRHVGKPVLIGRSEAVS